MRLRPLPDSPIVLQSLLKSAEQWLDANSHANRVADRYFDLDLARTMSTPELLAHFDEAAFIDDLYAQADLHRPACMDFVRHVNWPFDWEEADDERTNVARLLAASVAYKERRAWVSARYEHVDRHLKMDSEAIFLQFTREVRDKLEEIERERVRREIHRELTGGPPPDRAPGGDDTGGLRMTTAPQGGTPIEARKKRDQGKKLKVFGAYVAYLAKLAGGAGKTIDPPPRATELAKRFGCSTATACRAIKEAKDQYKHINQSDAADRYKRFTEADE